MNIRKTRHVYFELTDRSGLEEKMGEEEKREKRRGEEEYRSDDSWGEEEKIDQM